jgi:glycerol-3-phosphate dehydrogenase
VEDGVTTEHARVVVVGGGVIGCAVLREFARRGITGILLEVEPDLGEGASKANSAILHTGFDSKPGTIESTMLRRAAALWPAALDELNVPFLPLGGLMLARTADEARRLTSEIAANASLLGVATDLLDRAAVRDVAPYLADDVTAALSIPGEGVLDPFWLTRAYAEAAISGGSEVRLGQAVIGLQLAADGVTVRLADGSAIHAEQVVDAAGLRADEVAGLAGDTSFGITPRKGQFLVSEEAFGVDRIVLPIPGPHGKGMLVTPIVFGGLLLGPTAVDATEKDDRSTDPAEGRRILAACQAMVPALVAAVPVRQFAGLRPVSSTRDFILRPSTISDRLYLAAGIRSTGISTSPAVAEAVVDEVLARRGWPASVPLRALPAPPIDLSEPPGEIVCLCRSISRGEIEAACRQPTAPRTLDAIKRRSGATFGDCQGNLCSLDVAQIVATERAIPVSAVEKHRRGSWLWEAVADPAPADGRREPAEMPESADVIVIGAGVAGRAAERAATEAGASVIGVDRRAGATVVGLSRSDGGGWVALVQSAAGSAEIRASSVIVATGAYVEPREHRPIAGGRPAGVMTSDLAWQLLRHGLRPGRVVALVGNGSLVDELSAALADADARVIRLAEAPDALRGEIRLEGVRFAGRWHDADTLVLADRLLPQAFVLRGLGLTDARPGSPAPADADGRLPLDGLWAAGCVVNPSLDHRTCAEQGGRVGRLAAEAAARKKAGPAHPRVAAR